MNKQTIGMGTQRRYCSRRLMVILAVWLMILPSLAGCAAAILSPTPTATLASGIDVIATPTVRPAHAARPVDNGITLQRRTDSNLLVPGAGIAVKIELQGRPSDDCSGMPGRPVDALLVVDTSTSAGAGPGSNLERSAQLAQALVDHFAQPVYRQPAASAEQSRVGLVVSQAGRTGAEPLLLQDLTEDYALVHTQLAALAPGGDTDIAAGIHLAAQRLTQISQDRARAIVLLLHDNIALSEETRLAVQEVTADELTVFLIVNSLNLDVAKKITLELAAEVAPPERVFLDPDLSELRRLFIEASGGNRQVAGVVGLIDVWSGPDTPPVVQSLDAGGQAGGGKVRWDAVRVAPDETAMLGYRVTVSDAAHGDLQLQANWAWLDCNGYLHMGAGSDVTTRFQIATVTPPATIEAATEFPSRDANGGEIIGTPSSTPAGALPIRAATREPGSLPPGLPQLPGLGWIGLPWWLLLIPLLLLLLLLIWWLLRRQRSAPPILTPVAPGSRPTSASKPASRPPLSPGTSQPKKLNGGEDLTHGQSWCTVTDKAGRRLLLRWHPSVPEGRARLEAAQAADLTVSALLDKQSVGRAEAIFEETRSMNRLTGELQVRRNMRLRLLEVLPAERRQRIGTLLLVQAESYAREIDIAEVLVRPESEVARDFLRANGYTVHEDGQARKTLLPPSAS